MTKLDTSKKLSEVLKEMMREDGTAQMLLERRAQSLWFTVTGPFVQRNTTSVWVRNGVMHVELKSSVVRNELFNMKERIIIELNKMVGSNVIREIKLS